jgi:hypothetical protein
VHENLSPLVHGALGYAEGEDIHLLPGIVGSRLEAEVLAHETAHVLQQRPRSQLDERRTEGESVLEHEAEGAATALMRGRRLDSDLSFGYGPLFMKVRIKDPPGIAAVWKENYIQDAPPPPATEFEVSDHYRDGSVIFEVTVGNETEYITLYPGRFRRSVLR